MTVDLQRLLDAQEQLQAQSYGVSPRDLTEDEKIVFIKDMILAATDELHEMLGEVPAWKPWVSREKLAENGRKPYNVEAYRAEWIDLFHFVMNLGLVMNMTAEDIQSAYFKKREKNARRQELGYDGVSEKCPECKRALDDDAVLCVKSTNSHGEQFWCERTKTWTATA